MARFVVAGSTDCPYFARVELLADKLAKSLPAFDVHKVFVQPTDWETWLEGVCSENGWTHRKSPIVWRELLDRGGKGLLIGGANEFQEYARGYYGIESDMESELMMRVATENVDFKDTVDQEVSLKKSLIKPSKVCITNATDPICYHMLYDMAKGLVFGSDVLLSIVLLCEEEDQVPDLDDAISDSVDLAESLLHSISATNDPAKAFDNASYVVILDELERFECDDHDTWLTRNVEHFKALASQMTGKLAPNCKILVCGDGPTNLNCLTLCENVDTQGRYQNIVGLSRTIENQAKGILSPVLKSNSADIRDVIIWGNPSGTYHVDLERSRIFHHQGAIKGTETYHVKAKDFIYDTDWLADVFPEFLRNRTKAIAEKLQHRPHIAYARSINSLLRDWITGATVNQIYSLITYSTGLYGVPEDMFCSLPVRLDLKGVWAVVEDLQINETLRTNIDLAAKDLLIEKCVLHPELKDVYFPPIPPPDSESVMLSEVQAQDQPSELKPDVAADSALQPSTATVVTEGSAGSVEENADDATEKERSPEEGEGDDGDDNEAKVEDDEDDEED